MRDSEDGRVHGHRVLLFHDEFGAGHSLEALASRSHVDLAHLLAVLVREKLVILDVHLHDSIRAKV